MSRSPRPRWVLVGLAALALASLMLLPFVGRQGIALESVFGRDKGNMDALIFWHMRVPRVCAAFLAGAALSVSGTAFQAMFRNPLATPFTLGVSSGAALGAALYLKCGLAAAALGYAGVSISAFLGAMASIGVVYGLTRASRGFAAGTMLLAGIAVSYFFSSVILFIQYLSDFTQSFRIVQWLMGSVDVVGYEPVLRLLPFTLAGVLILAGLTRELNLLMTGDDLAISRGVNAARVKKIVFFATSLMVGGVVAVCGPIGFVGIMGPHICRLAVGSNHRYLTPASILFGGVFLALCDTVARTVIAPAELPVGVITALLGGPFFLWLLLGRSRHSAAASD